MAASYGPHTPPPNSIAPYCRRLSLCAAMHPAVGRVCTGLLGRAPLRRSFASAEGAVDGTKRLVLSFVSPYEKILTAVAVSQVNVKTTEGDLGILAGHVPSLLQLTPGLLQVITRGPLAGDLERKLSYFGTAAAAAVQCRRC